MTKGFERDDGLFVKSLDDALASFHVERQAYHGSSFIGNHIHRALKVNQLPLELKFNSIQIASKHSDSLYLYHKQGSVSE